MKKAEQILKQIDEDIEKPFVTARFGDQWKDYIKGQVDEGECDVDSIINIAWKQGRRAILLERAIVEILSNVAYSNDETK
jgi:hypothetical protein